MCHAANLSLHSDLVTVFLGETQASTQPLQSGTTQLWQQAGELAVQTASTEM